MTKKTKLLTFIVLIQTFCIFLLIGTIVKIRFSLHSLLKNELENESILQVSDKDNFKEDISLPFNISGSLVWWDQDAGLESIKNNHKYLDSVSPFWYELSQTGKIEKFTGAEDDDVLKTLEKHEIKISPIISNEFNRQPLGNIISNTKLRQDHIEQILNLAEKYDGISLNYENLNQEDRENFTNFVEELANKLHQNDKSLTVHLHAKTEEPGTWNGPKSQDWKALGQACDKLKIMAYDYSWSTSSPGPIAPTNWVEQIITYAKEVIPEEKIVLGIPLYGYDWTFSNNKWEGEGITYSQSKALIQHHNISPTIDPKTKSTQFTYKNDNQHEVWIENKQTFSDKIVLVNKYNINEISLWRLGEESPLIWEEINQRIID